MDHEKNLVLVKDHVMDRRVMDDRVKPRLVGDRMNDGDLLLLDEMHRLMKTFGVKVLMMMVYET